MPEFPGSTPLFIDVSIASGSVSITSEERDTTLVVVTPCSDSEHGRSAADDVILEGNRLTIETHQDKRRWFRDNRIKVDVHAPIDSSADVNVASATVNCRGRYGRVDVRSASGNVSIDEVTGDAKIQTASGDARIADVGGQLTASTASCDVTAATIGGPVRVKTASGDIDIAAAGGDVHSKSASGNLRVGTVRGGTISANSASGRGSVGVVSGIGVWLDLNSLSGSINSALDADDNTPHTHELTIQVRTVSGDIDILRAALKNAPVKAAI
ncbi:MAG: DUF4097 family beta strand repeat-containing protein [Chloroflexi bacterium]|nr:DUF4097 family beta strand repeat-containing protein [Chloroflexota bacterium]